jgi:hypothetical protein
MDNIKRFTLITITASNIFGIIPISSLIETKRYYGACLVSSAVLASIFMHATETKHNLPALFWAKYSKTFLNIDRVIAYMTGFYGLYLFYTNPVKTITQAVLPVIVGVSCAIGEHTENLTLYNICHCLWHGLAYYSLHLVNH